jgi:multidrug efflux pump subunit AcrA (membrane-fusion protein)
MTLSKFSRKATVTWFIAILILGLLFWRGRSRSAAAAEGGAGAANSATTGKVERRDLVQRVTISGRVASKRRLDVKPSFAGYVQKIFVHIGDDVKAGDPLVTFSPSLGSSEANFPVRAAFAGKVTQVLKTEGESVTDTGDQNVVLRVEDLTDLFVQVSIPELDIAKVKVGQSALIKLSSLAGESFNGKITEIALSAKEKDRWGSSSTEFQAKMLITSKDPRLLPGMSALCDVITNRAEKVLVLPHEYIQQDGEENYFVTTLDGQKRLIKLGMQTEEGAEVKSGLTEGEMVKAIDFLHLPKIED